MTHRAAEVRLSTRRVPRRRCRSALWEDGGRGGDLGHALDSMGGRVLAEARDQEDPLLQRTSREPETSLPLDVVGKCGPKIVAE